MPNSFIALVDSRAPISVDNAFQALADVSFLKHQYYWFIGQIQALPEEEAFLKLIGYTGIKKVTAVRQARLNDVLRVVRSVVGVPVAISGSVR